VIPGDHVNVCVNVNVDVNATIGSGTDWSNR
jgi:hypothetical protein